MLRFGTSGIPRSSPKPGTVHGIRRARELGLDHLEMAWVNGVKMSDESAAVRRRQMSQASGNRPRAKAARARSTAAAGINTVVPARLTSRRRMHYSA